MAMAFWAVPMAIGEPIVRRAGRPVMKAFALCLSSSVKLGFDETFNLSFSGSRVDECIEEGTLAMPDWGTKEEAGIIRTYIAGWEGTASAGKEGAGMMKGLYEHVIK